MARTARSRAKTSKRPRRTRPSAVRARTRAAPRKAKRTRATRSSRPKMAERRQPARSRPSRRTAGQAMPVREPATTPELDFGRGDEAAGRVGDRIPRQAYRERISSSREREAGRTGGEAEQRDRITPDDAARETMLDPEGLEGMNTPAEARKTPGADDRLSVVDESAIGAGGGTDEAEDAERQPIGREELQRIRQRVARSGGDARNVEPAESAAGSPGRDRNRPRERDHGQGQQRTPQQGEDRVPDKDRNPEGSQQ